MPLIAQITFECEISKCFEILEKQCPFFFSPSECMSVGVLLFFSLNLFKVSFGHDFFL